MDIVEIKVNRIRVDRYGYAPDGQYFGVGGGNLYAVDFYFPDGRHSRSLTRTTDSYQEVRYSLAPLGKVLR